MAISALVLGICAIVFTIIPCTWIIGTPCAILSIIFGIVGLVKVKKLGKGKGAALTGLILGVISMVIVIVIMTMAALIGTGTDYAMDEFKREMKREMNRSSYSSNNDDYNGENLLKDMVKLGKSYSEYKQARDDISEAWDTAWDEAIKEVNRDNPEMEDISREMENLSRELKKFKW